MNCGVVQAALGPCDTDPNECKISELCEKATTDNGGTKSWGTDEAEAYVAVAKEYGLKCGVKTVDNRTTQGVCTGDTVTQCSDKQLCDQGSSGSKSKITKSLQPYVLEAKKRGLTCGATRSFKQAFISEPKLKRQQLQYALKKLNFYSYGIDGLWGKGTHAGFKEFTSWAGLEGKSKSEVFRSLLSRVSVPSSFVSTCRENIKKCLNKSLCKYATTAKNNQMVWSKKFKNHYKEARRLNLHFGVNTQAKNTTSSSPTKSSNSNNTRGLTAIITYPNMPADQAYAVCSPQANLAGRNARRNQLSRNELNNSLGIGGGGWAGGILEAMSEAQAGNGAMNATMDACLAQYGWRD